MTTQEWPGADDCLCHVGAWSRYPYGDFASKSAGKLRGRLDGAEGSARCLEQGDRRAGLGGELVHKAFADDVG